MRHVFAVYLLFILAGITFFMVIGLPPLMRAFVRDNGVALLFGTLFFGSVAVQAWTGWHVFNHDAEAHGSETVGLGRYLISSHYGQAVLKNWQSEFLAVGAISIFSVFLRARHSAESKRVGVPHAETGTS